MLILDGETEAKQQERSLNVWLPQSNQTTSPLPGRGLVPYLNIDKKPRLHAPLCWASWLQTLNSGTVHRYQVSALSPRKKVSVTVNQPGKSQVSQQRGTSDTTVALPCTCVSHRQGYLAPNGDGRRDDCLCWETPAVTKFLGRAAVRGQSKQNALAKTRWQCTVFIKLACLPLQQHHFAGHHCHLFRGKRNGTKWFQQQDRFLPSVSCHLVDLWAEELDFMEVVQGV